MSEYDKNLVKKLQAENELLKKKLEEKPVKKKSKK